MKIMGTGLNDSNIISVNANDIRVFMKDMMEGWNTISHQNKEMDELSIRNYREYASENGNIYEQASTVLEYRLEHICSTIKSLTDVIEEDVVKKTSINEYAAARVGGIQ